MGLITAAAYKSVVAAKMTEKVLQSHVIGLATQLGWKVYHTHDSRRSQSGWPDLVLAHPVKGVVLFRELKTMRGKLSQDQKNWIGWLKAAGLDATVWRPDNLMDQTIEKTLRENRWRRGLAKSLLPPFYEEDDPSDASWIYENLESFRRTDHED
jgi:hypothetical protein